MPSRKHKSSKSHKKSHRGGNILESGEDLVRELLKMVGAGSRNQYGDIYGRGMAGGAVQMVLGPLQYPIPLAMLGDTYSVTQGMDLSIGT